jgi:hypothetical protein
MAIIVEINSNNTCCRENKVILDEQISLASFFNQAGKEGDAASESFRTQITKSIIDSVLKSVLPPSIIQNRVVYRSLVNILATIDIDDYSKLGFGSPAEKQRTCKIISSKLVQGLENTIIEMVTNALEKQIRKLAPTGDIDSPFTRIFGDILRGIASGGNLATQIAAGAFTEDVKGTITDQLSDAICEVDFTDIAKKSLGTFGGLINKGIEIGGGIGSFFKDLFKEEIENGKYEIIA